MDDPIPNAIAALTEALRLLPPELDSRPARVQIITTGLQESLLRYRRQIVSGRPVGPAAGLLQFEEGGGVRGVLNHRATQLMAQSVCRQRGVEPTSKAVWQALERDDVLAMAFGRLLLYADPQPLPASEDVEGSWQCYLRTWRPGAAERDYDNLRAKWARNRATAIEVVK